MTLASDSIETVPSFLVASKDDWIWRSEVLYIVRLRMSSGALILKRLERF